MCLYVLQPSLADSITSQAIYISVFVPATAGQVSNTVSIAVGKSPLIFPD